MIIARTTTIVIRITTIIRLQTLSFGFNYQILLLVNISDSFVIFSLII